MSDLSPTTGRTVISEKTRVAMPLIAMITGIIAICGAAGGTALIYAKITYTFAAMSTAMTTDKEAIHSEMKQNYDLLRQDVRDLQAVVMGNHYLDNPAIRGRPITRTLLPPEPTSPSP